MYTLLRLYDRYVAISFGILQRVIKSQRVLISPHILTQPKFSQSKFWLNSQTYF